METSNLTKERISEYLSKEKRFDNRKLDDFREINIETGVCKNAEGSARIKLGKTEVLVGIKLDAGEPYPDSPDEGVLVTTVELLPLSSERFEPGPPRIEAIELARIVDRGIRESGFIDFKKLCIKKNEKIWTIFLDIYTINDDGNLLDAAALGAIAALKDARMLKYDKDKEKAVYGEWTKDKLPLTKAIPLTITIYKIEDKLILDPTKEEEDTSEMRLSLAISEGPTINAIQKGGEKEVSTEELEKMIQVIEKRWKEMHAKICKKIEESTKSKQKE